MFLPSQTSDYGSSRPYSPQSCEKFLDSFDKTVCRVLVVSVDLVDLIDKQKKKKAEISSRLLVETVGVLIALYIVYIMRSYNTIYCVLPNFGHNLGTKCFELAQITFL